MCRIVPALFAVFAACGLPAVGLHTGPGSGVPGGMHPFPEQLDQVPEEQRLPEAIGLGFGGAALGGLIVFAGYALRIARQGLDGDSAKFAGGALAVALISGLLEVLRRRKPLTLVPQGPEIGVYRAGRLVQTVTVNQLTLYKLSFVNTFRELIILGMFGAVATFGVFFTVTAGGGAAVPFAWTLGVAVALDLAAYSSVLTRVLSKQYFLPSNEGAVAFTRASLRRVGWES